MSCRHTRALLTTRITAMELLLLPVAGTFMLLTAELFDCTFGLSAHARVPDFGSQASADKKVQAVTSTAPEVPVEFDRAA
jgi:hypothetical protein